MARSWQWRGRSHEPALRVLSVTSHVAIHICPPVATSATNKIVHLYAVVAFVVTGLSIFGILLFIFVSHCKRVLGLWALLPF